METWYLATVHQHTAHLYCLMDSIVTDGCIIVFDGFNDFGDLLWYLELRQLDELTQRLVTLTMNRLKFSFSPVVCLPLFDNSNEHILGAFGRDMANCLC